MEVTLSSETSVRTRITLHDIPEDVILQAIVIQNIWEVSYSVTDRIFAWSWLGDQTHTHQMCLKIEECRETPKLHFQMSSHKLTNNTILTSKVQPWMQLKRWKVCHEMTRVLGWKRKKNNNKGIRKYRYLWNKRIEIAGSGNCTSCSIGKRSDTKHCVKPWGT
jgi:hypothetical protein